MTKNQNGLPSYGSGRYEGLIYRYINKEEGGEFEWCYVGNTTNEKSRRGSWNKPNNKNYGGKKINEARKRHGLMNFEYEQIERCYDL